MSLYRAFFTLLIVTSFISSSSFSQPIQLRHQFEPGVNAKAQTRVQMNGNSWVHGKQAPTNMTMDMLRSIDISAVDSAGNADLKITVDRMTTNGRMGKEEFDEDLRDDPLKQTMFGQTEMSMQVSPLGMVKAADELGLQQMGISLPGQMQSGGGFELPTFPVEAVKVGDQWTESGKIIPYGARSGDVEGQRVYRLERIKQTPTGPAAIIRYQKKTEFGGFGLGDMGAALGAGAQAGPAAAIDGLTIDLQGIIEFDIKAGRVIQSDQQGFWNLKMKSAVEGRKQPIRTNQGMKIRIQSRFQWNDASPSGDTP